jgi:cold shock CspA family protein
LQKHQKVGNPYRVRIVMHIPPRHELIIRRENTKGDMYHPVNIVIAHAFDAAVRKARNLAKQQVGKVKQHPHQQLAAIVEKLFPIKRYGFLRTIDGRSIYFHANSVLRDDFNRLKIGAGVAFNEGMGEDGPQASSVRIVDNPSSNVSQDDANHTDSPNENA